MWFLLIVVSALHVDMACAQTTALAAKQAVSTATGAALQGDVRGALRALRSTPAEEFAGDDARFRACMLERFGANGVPEVPSEVHDSFLRDVLQAYRGYWWHTFMAGEREKHEARLLTALRELLGPAAATASELDAVEPVVSRELRARGYYSLQGVTPPLRELMVWSKQQSKSYPVQLPEGRHDTRVELLDEFVSFGWAHYATCGRRATGGWATEDALFAVVPRYKDIEGEEFEVTFLGHEAQHLADKRRFPGMEPWELEYRAKLTELALARTTRARVIEKFTESQGEDRSSPHAYANKRVLETVRGELGRSDKDAMHDLNPLPIHALQAAARAVLLADSRRREVARATTLR